MNLNKKELILKLQNKLKEWNIDYFILGDADPHNSEYVGTYYKLRSAFSGFTGSNGTLLVGQEGAWLWTDGRYFIQAEKELEGSGIVLMRMGEKNIPAMSEFLSQSEKECLAIGFDGLCFMSKAESDLKDALQMVGKSCCFYKKGGVVRDILTEEAVSDEFDSCQGKQIRVLPEHLRGEETTVRLEKLRKNMEQQGCDVYLSGKLDTNMWLLNLRGEDILYNPVAFSYVLVLKDSCVLFVKKEAVTEALKAYALQQNIYLEDYDNFQDRLSFYTEKKSVMTDLAYLNAETHEILKDHGERIVNHDGGLILMQAVKTHKEITLIKETYLKDSAAVCEFLCWLSKQEPGSITEYDAACKMDALRKEIPGNRGLSFHTISAYGANAAMMHYETKKEHCAVLEKGNLFLIDSGGQYDGGTTDVTRTVSIGEPTEEMRKHYTMVVRGMLALQNAVFMKGCTGMNLDILAREPMWEAHMDYKCGTGHGIGYMLSVHEGPQAIRMKSIGVAGQTEIVPGMLVSDEPGIYLEGKYGIRMENILLCEEVCENADGTFLRFEPLTFVPLAMNLIKKDAMEPKERKQLEDYQKLVYQKIAPLLSKEEAEWLAAETGCFAEDN